MYFEVLVLASHRFRISCRSTSSISKSTVSSNPRFISPIFVLSSFILFDKRSISFSCEMVIFDAFDECVHWSHDMIHYHVLVFFRF